ncbi:MAG: alpha/beta fold hydrolase [Actinobacteria bacterium]|nr:alpha/beta fold hydrolase [Actinomycetota bacterium]
MAIHPMRFRTADGLWLEGRICVPDRTRGAAILCHPYPLMQGSMSSILIPVLQRALDAAGWASLRFNFRGVGRSEGRFERGIGETKDALAALDLVVAETRAERLAVIGWSFGAMVGLRAAARDARVTDYVAVAPPVTVSSIEYEGPAPEHLERWRARAFGICGTDDRFCDPADMRAWLGSVSPAANTHVVDGADHFFTGHRDELTTAVAEFLA